ncbi:MAG: CocE/NonD family hydrolase [Moraxellaceae bacterium]|nr:CocE/NonD family hydrolase [Moraxellaceae bacterium]MDP1776851.1 CocE/NonD family hydrolase [Moraxellaceae bacterium]
MLPTFITRKTLFAATTAIVLAACGSNDNSGANNGSGQARSEQRITLGNRSSEASFKPILSQPANTEWQSYDRPADYAGVTKLPTTFITMRDGVQLAASVTLPALSEGQVDTGKYPTILIQTSYNLSAGSLVSAIGGADPFMVQRGYATVVVDVRGTGNSTGKWEAFGAEEQADFKEVAEWVTQQSWSNGSIGVFGVSYLGITAILTAQQQHPAVKAAFPIVPIGDGYRDIVFTGGNVNATFIPLWMGLITGLGALSFDALQADPAVGLQSIIGNLLNAITGFQVPTMLKALLGESETVYDGDFWAERSPIEGANKVNVPTFIVGGLFDLFQRSEPMWFEALKGQVPVKLLIGPWTHIEAAGVPSNGLPQDGVPNLQQLQLQWFDQYVMGLDTNAAAQPNVTQYVLGLDRYQITSDWPHPAMKPEVFFLQPEGTVTKQQPTAENATHTVLQQPLNGLCSSSTTQWTAGITAMLPIPCFSDNTLAETGAAQFLTPVSEEGFYINGPMQANIWVSTTAMDTNVSVRIDLIGVGGSSEPVTNGLLTASHRHVDESRSRIMNGVMLQPWHTYRIDTLMPVKPNEPMLIPIEIFPSAAYVPPGARLRISINSSNFPQGLQPVPTLLKSVLGIMTVHTDSQHPSSIVLPVVPVSALSLN